MIENRADIEKELNSPEYKAAIEQHLLINNAIIQCLWFINTNCSRHPSLCKNLFATYVIDHIFQCIVAIKVLATEGIMNTCKRELRFLIEVSIKASYISQKFSELPIQEQVSKYKKQLSSTNISMVDHVDLYMLSDENKKLFSSEIKRQYGELCNYAHFTPHQINERTGLDEKGRYIGHEGTNELIELNNEMKRVYAFVLTLFFHAIPKWCVGDYLVERNGETINWFFVKSKYIADVDHEFDYKHERQKILDQLKIKRIEAVEF